MAVTRLPVWLYADGTERGRLQATSCSLDLSVTDLPKATITMVSSDDIPGTHDFVEIFTEHGSAGIFRVVSSSYKYAQTCQIQLIGAADTLSDDVWAEAASEATTQSATTWITAILSHQTTARWQLGTCALSANVKMKVNYSELWGMLETVRQARTGYRWIYDYTTTPWTLSLIQMPDTVESEFRVTRNIESAQITVSDQQMCNRLIFTVTDANEDGTPTITTYNDTTSQARYGIRTRCTDIKTEEIPTGMTAAQYAQQLLSEHAVPDFSIQITGADLSKLTGMDFDHIQLGYLCSAVLPEYGEAVQERVVSLSYPDVLNTPSQVKVSLSTEIGAITGSLASAKKVAAAVRAARGGGGGGGGAKADIDSWAKVLTDVIEATDGTGIKEMWQSGITMTSHGGVRLFSLYQGLASLDSELVITNSNISAEVTRATAAEGTLSGRIDVEAGKIALVVEATSGGNVIKAASIVAAINDTGSSVAITADHINLDGYTTGGDVTLGSISAEVLASERVNTGDITMAGTFSSGGAYMTTHSFKIDNVEKAKFLGSADVNFDRAAAKAEGAAAVSVTLDTGSWTAVDSSTGDYRRTVTAKKDGTSAATSTISAQQIWNLGWNACRSWVLNNGHTVLSGYSSWNSGNAAALYVAPTGGAQMATGQTQKWRYGGTVTTYYSAPASK